MRDQALKMVLWAVGLLFVALTYPIVAMGLDETLQMMLSIYVTLGVFLVLAARNPAAHRSLIAFAGWSSVVHAAVMTVQSVNDAGERMHLLIGSAAFVLIGVALIALMPGRRQVVAA